MLLSLLVGAVNAQVARDWTKRSSLPDSGNNILVKTVLFTPSKQGQLESVYSLSSVTMLDGRTVFQVLKRRRDGSVIWNRVGSIATGNQRVWAKDIALDVDGNVVVLAEIKQRADYDLMVYRYAAADGTPGAKTLLRNKWQDINWNINDADNRAVSLAVTRDGGVQNQGAAFVLSSELGDPNEGRYTRVDKVNVDGSVEWTTRYSKARDVDYVGPVLSDPKALVLDSAGMAPFVLVHTLADKRMDDMTVVSFNTSGNLQWQVSFGAQLPNGNDDPIELEDIPITMAGNSNGLFVVGNTITYTTRNGQPYPIKSETVFGVSTFGGFLGSNINTQVDSFGRPGQFNPKTITTNNSMFLVGGNVEPFSLRTNNYVRGFSLNGAQLMLNFNGPMGSINAVTSDQQGNIYATGVEFLKKGTGFENKGVLFMLSPAGGAGQVIFKTHVALNTKNPGTQGVSVDVNSAGDIYLGSREYVLNADGTTSATVAVWRFVQEPFVTLMQTSPAGVPGGETFSLYVELNKPALSGGFKFKLTANNPGVALPAELVVPAGEDEWTFTLQSTQVQQTQDVTLTANPGGATAMIRVFSGWVKSLTLTKTDVLGGASLQGTVVLNGPAPAGGSVVQLSTTSPTAVLPKDDFVLVPAGASQRTFPIGTKAVTSITEVFIGATYNSTARVKLNIHPAQITAFTAPTTINGGSFGNATVTISGPAPDAGLPVTIVSDSDALAGMTVLVPKDQTSLTFRLNTMPVSADTVVNLTAKTSIASMSANVTVKAAVLKAVRMDPTSIVGGGTAYVVVDLTALTPSGGEPITLSSNSAAATVTANATVAAGKSQVKVPVKTAVVNGTTTAEISVTHKGVTMKTTLTITSAP